MSYKIPHDQIDKFIGIVLWCAILFVRCMRCMRVHGEDIAKVYDRMTLTQP